MRGTRSRKKTDFEKVLGFDVFIREATRPQRCFDFVHCGLVPDEVCLRQGALVGLLQRMVNRNLHPVHEVKGISRDNRVPVLSIRVLCHDERAQQHTTRAGWRSARVHERSAHTHLSAIVSEAGPS